MEIRCDSAEELRTHILILLAKIESQCRIRTAFCRSISERRANIAATDAYEHARKTVEAIVIKPRFYREDNDEAE